MEEKSHTRSALHTIAFLGLYILIALTFLMLATVTEFPTQRSGIYVLFAAVYIIQHMLFPGVQLVSAGIGIYHTICSLKNGENRKMNIALLLFFLFLIPAALQYGWRFIYCAIMSV